MATPITLMYHSIITSSADVPPGREPGAQLYDVRVEDFQEQMRHIHELGHTLPQIILTFDDGEMNNFQNAFRILKKSDRFAYFFITSERIGQSGYMGPDELNILADNNMMIGSHGKTHRILTELNDQDLRQEFVDSKKQLEQIIGMPVTAFSVPRGFCDQRVLAFAREAGYKEIFVSNVMQADEGVISRIAIKGNWSLQRFEMALRREVPLGERAFELIKNIVKYAAGPGRYDKIRTKLMEKK